MPLKHVILREANDGAALGGIPRARTATVASAAPVRVEVGEISLGSAANLERKKGIKCVAPVMPMKLIAPVSADATTPATGLAWGVRAVCADTSPYSGDGIVAAVLDTGIDPTHPAFAGAELVRRNFTT